MTNTNSLHMKAGIACLMVLFAVASVFMTQAIFLELSQSFGVDLARARFTFSVSSLSYAAAFFFIGPISDRFDLPKMACFGLIFVAVGLVGASISDNFSLFIGAMGLAGFSAALVPASMFPHITRIVPQDQRGPFIGGIVASGTLGIVLGRVIMGLLTARFGWPLAFRMLAILLLLIVFAARMILMEKENTGETSHQSLARLYLRSLGLLTMGRPVLLFSSGFLLFFGFLGMVTFLTYRLVTPPFSFTSAEVGWISMAGVTAVIAPFAGHLATTRGIFKVVLPGLATAIASLQLLGWFPTVPAVTAGLLLLFAGVYCCQPLIFLLIGQAVPQESLGSASSLYILVCIGGGSISSMVLGPVWASYGWPGITLACTASLAMAAAALGGLAMHERKTLISPDNTPEPQLRAEG